VDAWSLSWSNSVNSCISVLWMMSVVKELLMRCLPIHLYSANKYKT